MWQTSAIVTDILAAPGQLVYEFGVEFAGYLVV